MNIKEKIIETPKSQSNNSSKICPDFDEDCNEVKCHISCFLGLIGNNKLGMAKGLCPFIHTEN